MTITIPDEIITTTQLSEKELRTELAVFLFENQKLTAGQASHIAEMSQLQFQHLLSSREISIHYDVKDFETDRKTIQRLSLNEPKQ